MLKRCSHGFLQKLCVVVGCEHYDGRKTREQRHKAPSRQNRHLIFQRIWQVHRENPQLTAKEIATRLGCGLDMIRLALRKIAP